MADDRRERDKHDYKRQDEGRPTARRGGLGAATRSE
jgi:hypothetical protein